MYHFFLIRGVSLDKLINLSETEKLFYIASMQIAQEEDANKISIF